MFDEPCTNIISYLLLVRCHQCQWHFSVFQFIAFWLSLFNDEITFFFRHLNIRIEIGFLSFFFHLGDFLPYHTKMWKKMWRKFIQWCKSNSMKYPIQILSLLKRKHTILIASLIVVIKMMKLIQLLWQNSYKIRSVTQQITRQFCLLLTSFSVIAYFGWIVVKLILNSTCCSSWAPLCCRLQIIIIFVIIFMTFSVINFLCNSN